MSRIYSNTNRIRFTDIPEKYSIPRQFRAKQSEMHSAVVTYVFDHYKNTKKYRQKIVDVLNCLTYCVIQNEPPSFKWVSTDPLDTMPDMDLDLVESSLGDFFLTQEAIEWDVSPTDNVDLVASSESSKKPSLSDSKQKAKPSQRKDVTNDPKSGVTNHPLNQIKKQQKVEFSTSTSTIPTPKEDLYIQPPRCPRFDVNKVWISATIGNDNLVIYTTLPEVPTRQNEVSVTTNVDIMTDSELMSLYPNHSIHTRAQQMYEHYDSLGYDDDIGCIIPIEGFTQEQVVDNIIKYPHLYRLRKVGPEGKLMKFFSTIEINGELVPVNDIWDQLPESNLMPRDPEFVKEYVIRRYLLERDNGMIHKYPMFGCLDPFLTLFMPYDKYIERGYSDALSIVKKCVASRVRYKQTRSPILRRIEQNV